MPSCHYPPMSAKVSQSTSKLDGRNVGVDICSCVIGLPCEGLRVPPPFQRLSGVHWHARVSDLSVQGRTCSVIRSRQACSGAVHRSMRSGKFFGIRSPNTTAMYAKVDLAALRTVALSWPGDAK